MINMFRCIYFLDWVLFLFIMITTFVKIWRFKWFHLYLILNILDHSCSCRIYTYIFGIYIEYIYEYIYWTWAPTGNFSGGGSEVHQRSAWNGVRRVGGSGGGAPRTAEKFSKNVKNQWKNYNFFLNFKKISRFFQKFFENFIEFLA